MIKEWLGTKLTNFLEKWDYFPTIFNFGYPRFLSLPVSSRLQTHQSQRGSSLNTDRFPKRAPKAQASRRFRENALLGNAFEFNSVKSPFMDFWVVQTGYWPVPFSLDGALQNSGLLLLFLMPRNKNLSNFPEKMETSVDLHLGILMGFGLFCATYWLLCFGVQSLSF